MTLAWVLIIFLIVNALFTDVLVNWPLALWQLTETALSWSGLGLIIIVVSWLIGED